MGTSLSKVKGPNRRCGEGSDHNEAKITFKGLEGFGLEENSVRDICF